MSGDAFVHPSEIRGLCLMKSPEEMVLKICHAFEIQKKIHIYSFISYSKNMANFDVF